MPTNTNSSDTFRIYVASLSDYNASILHGTWIDFAQLTDLDDLRAAIAAMLATSPTAKAAPGQPAEEWMMPHSSFPICSAPLHMRHPLVTGGVSMPIIKERMGHTNITTTARYAHFSPSDLRHAAKLLGN